MADNENWKLEEDESSENVQVAEPETGSKLELFKQSHPGAYTKEDIDAVEAEIKQKTADHHRAWLVLVDSDTEDWGIAEDTCGELLWIPHQGDIVGTWTRSSLDGCIHISLLSTVSALEDKAIAIWQKYSEERAIQKKAGKRASSGTKKKAVVVEEETASTVENIVVFNSLRAKLRRAKDGG